MNEQGIQARVHGGLLHAPPLSEFEVANACLKKMLTFPGEREALLEAFSVLNALSTALERFPVAV